MALPILQEPGIFCFFLQENPMPIPSFRGRVLGFLKGGGGNANVIFMGVGIFPTVEQGEGAEYDRRRFHRTTEVIPRRAWKSKSPFASRHIFDESCQKGG